MPPSILASLPVVTRLIATKTVLVLPHSKVTLENFFTFGALGTWTCRFILPKSAKLVNCHVSCLVESAIRKCLCLCGLSPTSRIYINWRPTLIFVQPPLHPLMFELQTLTPPIFHVSIVLINPHPFLFELLTLDFTPPLLCLYCLHKPDPSATDSI